MATDALQRLRSEILALSEADRAELVDRAEFRRRIRARLEDR